jgi:hypothetical protein
MSRQELVRMTSCWVARLEPFDNSGVSGSAPCSMSTSMVRRKPALCGVVRRCRVESPDACRTFWIAGTTIVRAGTVALRDLDQRCHRAARADGGGIMP